MLAHYGGEPITVPLRYTPLTAGVALDDYDEEDETMATVDYTSEVAVATFPEFGAPSHFYAAEIVDASGRIYAVVMEPAARADYDPDFDDDAFRDAVRQWAAEEVGPESEFNGELPVYLVFDPARDQTEEEVIREG